MARWSAQRSVLPLERVYQWGGNALLLLSAPVNGI